MSKVKKKKKMIENRYNITSNLMERIDTRTYDGVTKRIRLECHVLSVHESPIKTALIDIVRL